jgi:hypothetical protein
MQAFFYIDGIPTKGAWLDLEYLSDFDEVLEALANDGLILRNEDDEPQYDGDVLVSDIEGDLPRAFYTSSIDAFDLSGFVECRDDCDRNRIDYDAAAAYLDWSNGPWSLDSFQDAYRGKADDETKFAEDWLEETGQLDEIPEHLRFYFDYEAFARDLFINDFYLHNGYVFDRNC